MKTLVSFIISLLFLALPAHAIPWGTLVTPSQVVKIRSQRSTESKPVGKLYPGNRVIADFLKNDWYAVFDINETLREESRALGYAYAALFKIVDQSRFPSIFLKTESKKAVPSSVSDNICRLEAGLDQDVLKTIATRLSRISDPHTGDLPEMISHRTIRVLTTYSKTHYFIADGQSFGFEYSLMKDYEKYLNRNRNRRQLEIVVEFFPVPAGQLIPSLLAGLGDIIAAGLIVTPERQEKIDFTDPYFSEIREVVVTHRGTPEIISLQDLAGKQFYLRPISSYFESIGNLNARLVGKGLPPVQIVWANPFLKAEDILEMINAGIIDLTLMENRRAKMWSSILSNLVILEHAPVHQNAEMAWGIRKNSPLLKKSLNRFLLKHKPGTLNGNIYLKRYYQNVKWIENPLSPGIRERFSEYSPLFKKYGALYGFDWIFLAALSYQESRLDPGKRSHAGAIGLMQVREETAQDHRIRVSDITINDNNVHAAVKYLALLRDVYFSDKRFSPDARVRFALAAYNAGPKKILECRKLASRMGYNRFKWLGHCEFAALRIIGEETVRFVGNINKYYLAYTLSDTLECLKQKPINDLLNTSP